MNNTQFRNLLFDKSQKEESSSPSQDAASKPSAFGGKRASFLPMTPRNVKGATDVDFARQVRERNAALGQQPATKKFKSRDPRGIKLGEGYTDRAKARAEATQKQDEEGESEAESKAARIQALEEQLKEEKISQEAFEAMRDEITGGDVSNTHLVKGLDRRLLERVRKGEDVLGTGNGDGKSKSPPDVDDELDKLGEKEVQAVRKETGEKKKGTLAPPAALAGKKRSRNEIMAELKAQRQAAAQVKAAATPTFDTSKWRKVGEKQKDRVEIDAKGREVLITVDEEGVVKKKVRKVPAKNQHEGLDDGAAQDMPDESKPVLGADAIMPAPPSVPAAPPEEKESDDDDIFEGVGTDYDPLGNVGDDDDDDSEEDDEQEDRKGSRKQTAAKPAEGAAPVPGSSKPRNYFGNTTSQSKEETEQADRFAGVQNLLKKAAKQGEENHGDDEEDEDDLTADEKAAKAARAQRRKEMLAQADRDMEDMDMGFGSSRYEDEAEAGDGDGKRVRLSEWKGKAGGLGGEDEGGWEEGGKEKKKRKGRKRKGDGDSAADVMRVIEGRKGKAEGK